MKNTLLIIGFVSLCLYGFTQEGYIGIGIGGALPLGGYSGVETDEGDYKDVGFAEHGYAMKFIDVQYKFYKNIGVSYSWWKHNHSLDENAYTNEYIKLEIQNTGTHYLDTETDDDYWSFSTHTLGFSLSTSSKPFDFNIKTSITITPGVRVPELNVTWTDTTGSSSNNGSSNTRSATSNSSTGFSLGMGGKYYLNNHWAITGGVDYFSQKVELPIRRIKITTDATGLYYGTPTKKEDLMINFISLSFGVGYVW